MLQLSGLISLWYGIKKLHMVHLFWKFRVFGLSENKYQTDGGILLRKAKNSHNIERKNLGVWFFQDRFRLIFTTLTYSSKSIWLKSEKDMQKLCMPRCWLVHWGRELELLCEDRFRELRWGTWQKLENNFDHPKSKLFPDCLRLLLNRSNADLVCNVLFQINEK